MNMNDLVGAHNDLHSEHGARKGEHPGRSRNPVIKVADLAWLEFEKSDLASHGPRRSPPRSVSPQRCGPTTSCTYGAPMRASRA
jgi:hypothetical protein